MEKAPTRFAQYEQAAAAALAENERLTAIEAKLTSPEVAALNDQAQLEIWGSGDRTYTNPETGEAIATPENPMVGVLDDFSKTRPGPEAKAMAEKYESQLTDLLDEGFELCQAKLVMDMRTTDEQDGIPNLTAQLMKNESLSADQAEKKAWTVYYDKDLKRQELVKENGIVTAEEYARVRNGGEADGDGVSAEGDEPTDDTPKEEDEPDEKDPEAEKLQEKIETARDEYARLLAETSVTLRGAKNGKRREALDVARTAWITAAKDIADYGQKSTLNKFKNLSNAEIKELKRAQVSHALIQEQYLLEEKKYQHAEAISERGPKGFLKLWREKSGEGKVARRTKTIAKIGLTAGLIAAAGVAAPVAGAAGFGARSHGKRFDQLAEKAGLDADQAYRKTEMLKKQKKSGFSFEDIADVTLEMTNARVGTNRGKFAGSLAAGAALGYGAGQLAEMLSGGAEASGEATNEALTNNGESLVDGEVPNQTFTEVETSVTGGENASELGSGSEGQDAVAGTEATEAPEFAPSELEVGVENGDGFTNLLHRQFGLGGNESFLLYQDLVENMGGENIIDGIGTYMENGEYRISSPGDAQWTPEARTFIEEWIANRTQV